ncbi:MAG: hypothetical protein LOY03_01610 [Cyclobacteriaceae bacterium]|nr:hypothetical protein [Cyclobacteriaceae bacterium]
MKTVLSWLTRSVHGLCVLLLLVTFISCNSDDDKGGTPVNDIDITSVDPESPATLEFYETGASDRVTIEYDYNISHPEGARIWIIPYTDGDASEGFVYSSSGVFKGSGKRTVLVSVEDPGTGPTHVDQLRISIKNPDQSVQLVERFVDVDYTFE